MTFCLITNSVSPHQMPLAQELARHLGSEGFRYIATSEPQSDRVALGWAQAITPDWVLQPAVNQKDAARAAEWAENADIVLCGIRDLELFERRCSLNKATLYMSERWFKPPAGMMRLCYAPFFLKARRLLRLLSSPHFYYLPIGLYAVTDMRRLVSLLRPFISHASAVSLCNKQRLWGYFVGASENREPRTGGIIRQDDRINRTGDGSRKDARTQRAANGEHDVKGQRTEVSSSRVLKCESALVWKKATEDGEQTTEDGKCSTYEQMNERNNELPPINMRTSECLRILWFGRLIDLKRADLLIEAVKRLTELPGLPVSLKIIGQGYMETQLRKKVSDLGLGACVDFCPPKPILEIRTAIRDADVCVVTSNAQEGWGVAVNEGLIEGRCVIASDATGAGATLIHDGVNGLLFKSGRCEDLTRQIQRVREDRGLLANLRNEAKKTMLDDWTPKVAAERLVAFSESLLSGSEPPQWASGPLSFV